MSVPKVLVSVPKVTPVCLGNDHTSSTNVSTGGEWPHPRARAPWANAGMQTACGKEAALPATHDDIELHLLATRGTKLTSRVCCRGAAPPQEMVLEGLGLAKCRDTIIGNQMMRGVSGARVCMRGSAQAL